jgi:hypothetical protein
MEKEVKKKYLSKMAIPVMKLWVKMDDMQKAKETMEKEELQWLYGQTEGLLKTIYRLMSGEQ